MITIEQRREWGMKGAIGKWSKEPPYAERFWSHVHIDERDSCWLWNGCISKKTGYGKYKIRGGHTSAHRIAYELFYGINPKGFNICHECDTRRCCNPYHLYAGTLQDNMDDMVRHERQHRPTGNKHHNRKLSESDVIKILGLRDTITHRDIATMFGVSRGAIHSIFAGKSWVHVQPSPKS